MKTNKIFVAGSSWARGEWGKDNPVVQHDGIKQYFSDYGYQVIDASRARSYHSRVTTYLDIKLSNNYAENDIVFFVLADPILDIIMPELDALRIKRTIDVKNLKILTEKVKEAGGLINLIRNQQDFIYNELDTLAKKYHTKIHLIGGTYNVNTEISNKYSNLEPTVISWIDLLVGQLEEYPQVGDPNFGISYTWNVDYIDLSTYTAEFANQVREECLSVMSPSKTLLEELIFHPDGLHPNREGHKILFEHLVEKLKL